MACNWWELHVVGCLVQWLERLAVNQEVVGSNPTAPFKAAESLEYQHTLQTKAVMPPTITNKSSVTVQWCAVILSEGFRLLFP